MLPIIQKRKIFFTISGILVAVSIAFLASFGLKPGLDFTGGTLFEFEFTEKRPELTQIQQSLSDVNLGAVVLQQTGDNGYLLKTRFITSDEHQKILTELRTDFEKENNKVLEQRFETIGPAISAELRNRSVKTGIFVSLAIVAYIAYSFRKVSRPVQSWKYGVVAMIALAHNVIITMGVFSALGKYMGVEVGIPFVVALLTILGATVNDTIVVFDRIREKLIRRSANNFAETVNIAVNETIGRSLNISLAIALTLAALLFFGGETIHYFSLALLIGIISGTYSSIFLASPMLVSWQELGKQK